MESMVEQKNQEIEILAFDIFQEKLGLRLKPNLTFEEKKKITDIPAYQQYRDEALKVYNQRQAKKERAIFNKKYPIIKVEASGKPEWYKGARTMCFVYSKNHGNFILEGYRGEVEEYLKKYYTHYLCYISMWHHGRSRGMWYFWKKNIGIFTPSKIRKDWKYEIRPYSVSGGNNLTKEEINEKTFRFKRLPKHWIPEFDKL